MSDLQALLEQLSYAAGNPRAMLERHLAAGRKVIGCFPSYTPEELVYAAGMIPMGIWGAPVEPYLAKTYLPAFACPILQSTLELGLQGKYKGLSAVLIPTLCDTFRCITQDWLAGVPDIPMIPVSYPQNRTEAGLRFLTMEYEIVRGKLEAIAGREISDSAIMEAIAVYDRHAEAMRQFSAAAADHPDVITPLLRHRIMKSAWFMDKAEHTRLTEALTAELRSLPVCPWKGRRVLLTGIAAEPEELLEILEENGLAVAGDDLAQESRQYTSSFPKDASSPTACLAGKWKTQLCSLAHDAEKTRVDMLAELARTAKADGVIACMMKFCDPEEYDLPLIFSALSEVGIPTLSVEIDLQPASMGQIRTRIQAFAEMLG